MGRPGYMSIYADERTQKIFDEYTKTKGISKNLALSEMMQTYMLAQDEELYMKLLKESFNISKTREIIRVREDSTPINDYIFLKLGTAYTSNDIELNGKETMEAYKRAISLKGYSWFSTMSLHTGMAKDKIKFYNKIIKSGEVVKILFALGMGINNVCYSAKIEEIVSSRDEILCPGDPSSIPKEFGIEEKGKIWFRLTRLEEENKIKVEDLKFRKDNGSVKNAITKSQFHFGYVYIG